jgi:AcrR family transcriptional regulator
LQEIEQMFNQWTPVAQIAREFRVTRQSIYRHFSATGKLETRCENVRGLFRALIANGMEARRMTVPPAVVLAAAVAISKLDNQNRTVDRLESLNPEFEFLSDVRWRRGEMERYAETGILPNWFGQ